MWRGEGGKERVAEQVKRPQGDRNRPEITSEGWGVNHDRRGRFAVVVFCGGVPPGCVCVRGGGGGRGGDRHLA